MSTDIEERETALQRARRAVNAKRLESAVLRTAAHAVVESEDEARYVYDLIRFKAGLLKLPPVPRDEDGQPWTTKTVRALNRQADTLYAMMVAGHA